MKYITKGESHINTLHHKVDLTNNIITIFERYPDVGDYIFYDKIAQKLICISSLANLSNYPSDNYAPIGIVVIPASHNVYGDGSCGIMSLKVMNCNAPTIGGDSTGTMYWGNNAIEIPSLSNLYRVSIGNTSDGIPTGQKENGNLPSSKFTNILCMHDIDAYYYDSSYSLIPSPYLTDESRNPGYYQTTSPSSSMNCLADFDGVGNTEKIIAQRGDKDYSSWIPTYNSENDYPAASCCNMFYTAGTSQEDWYLPAMGELGYMMVQFNRINAAIIRLLELYGGSFGSTIPNYGYYWSSSQYNMGNARYINIFSGNISYLGKNKDLIVRAFLRVGGTSKISLKVI